MRGRQAPWSSSNDAISLEFTGCAVRGPSGRVLAFAHARRGCWGGFNRSYPEVRHEASYGSDRRGRGFVSVGAGRNGHRGRAGAVDDAATDVRRPADGHQRGGRIVRAADHRGADQRRHRRPVREHATAPDVPQPIRQPHRGAVHAAGRAWNQGRRVRVLERRAEDRRRGVRARRRPTGVPERDPAPPRSGPARGDGRRRVLVRGVADRTR